MITRTERIQLEQQLDELSATKRSIINDLDYGLGAFINAGLRVSGPAEYLAQHGNQFWQANYGELQMSDQRLRTLGQEMMETVEQQYRQERLQLEIRLEEPTRWD